MQFLGLSPQIAVITNVEFDHPDLFLNASEMFGSLLKNLLVVLRQGYGLFCFAFDRDNSQNNTCE